MSLGYPPLDEKSTQAIWKMNIQRTQTFFQEKLEIKQDEILRFAKMHFRETVREGGEASAWNGRQIRNGNEFPITLKHLQLTNHEKHSKPLLHSLNGKQCNRTQKHQRFWGRNSSKK